MELQFFGAAKEVTGSCHSLTTKETKLLVDCGMFQGSKEMERLNYENFSFDPASYPIILLTHAHLDHCGRIPKLVKFGFKGKIYATNATKELARVVMLDAAKIAAEDTEHENKRRAKQGLPARKPIYNQIDVKNALKLFVTVKFEEEVKISKDILTKYYDSGHILGSACIQLKVTEGKKTNTIVFSGDVGQADAVLVKNFTPIEKGDYVLIESTYGDRLHPPIEERQKQLIRIINESYKKGGKLLIPAFAVERTQEMLYYIGQFMRKGLIPKMDVYLDSPMAIRATEVFSKYPEYYNKDVQASIKERKDPFDFPELIKTQDAQKSKLINSVTKPCIVIAGNGMCTAGRIKHHIRNNISDPKTTLLFIGYQVEGTLGYWIKKGEKKIKLLGIEVPVRAKIEVIDGFSAHADANGLMSWLSSYNPKPKKVFIIHGDENSSKAFKEKIDQLGFTSYIPSIGDKIEL